MNEKKVKNVGGQAVIEGVMMKSPDRIATAVRRSNGEIVYKVKELSKNNKFLSKIPFIRGGFILIESLFVGIKELTFSANQFEEEEEDLSDFQLALTVFVSMSLGVGLFILLPSFISNFIFQNSLSSANILEAILRMIFFIVYIKLISFSKDIKRVFQYHGAEHKSIYTFENNEKLTKENAKKYTTLHPRCGTSFLLIVMIISIIIYSLVDIFLPTPDTLLMKQVMKLSTRILLLPFVAGASYEFQKYTSRHLKNPIIRLLAAPGLKLQNITTKEPDFDQLEVGVVALRAALGETIENAKDITEEELQ
ncbi:uncharacterized protein YqhQ [Hypnocyclicus thermotrophus]|uniref:Uncharacterized protein YqhQ n=1 Tax=Hypnocyclicus thermotrophus TaxID=1627895 RepID=A0AA46DXE8_9FUSO|nr:DUF1385 domain-containing protein [Hypnocyclicus thermotrophus]TDT68045.1 uncharacterized protein YqhQ [Hypnocyclicus thermotrophus]